MQRERRRIQQRADPSVHDKDPALVARVEELGKQVTVAEADVGQAQIEIYRMIQKNPSLLDGPEGPKLSNQIAVMREMQALLPPPSAGKELEKIEWGLLMPESLKARVPHGEVFPPRPAETGPGPFALLSGTCRVVA